MIYDRKSTQKLRQKGLALFRSILLYLVNTIGRDYSHSSCSGKRRDRATNPIPSPFQQNMW